MSTPQRIVEDVPRLTSYFRCAHWWTFGLSVFVATLRNYLPQTYSFAVGVFLAPQVPSSFERPLTLRACQAHSRRVPQPRRLHVDTDSIKRGRALLCGVAFASVLHSLRTAVLPLLRY